MDKNRRIGIDVGCGTGWSAQELANFCEQVVGLDSNMPMLFKARKHKKVNYVNSPGEQMPIAANSVDVVTLAGSLNYIERDSLVTELVRICRAEAEIVVYDFEICLTDFEEYFGIKRENSTPEYDHSSNLCKHSDFAEVAIVKDEESTNASPLEIAHLLLSNRERHNALCGIYKNSHPVTLIENEISSMFNISRFKSNIFYSVYALSQN